MYVLAFPPLDLISWLLYFLRQWLHISRSDARPYATVDMFGKDKKPIAALHIYLPHSGKKGDLEPFKKCSYKGKKCKLTWQELALDWQLLDRRHGKWSPLETRLTICLNLEAWELKTYKYIEMVYFYSCSPSACSKILVLIFNVLACY